MRIFFRLNIIQICWLAPNENTYSVWKAKIPEPFSIFHHSQNGINLGNMGRTKFKHPSFESLTTLQPTNNKVIPL